MGSGTMVAPAAPLDFYDVRDPVAFVHANINKWCRATGARGAIVLSIFEREELHAEGMAIMCKLAREFQPHMDGYAQAGCFSGFAAMFLARKLGDAWHRQHEEHLLITEKESGRRHWLYGECAVSYELLTSEDEEGHGMALGAVEQSERPAASVEQMLRDQLEERMDVALRVAGLLGEGLTSDREIAELLGLTVEMVREARSDLEPVAQRLRTLSQR